MTTNYSNAENRLMSETKDVLNEIAWRDFVLFAWGEDDAHAAFRGATGRPQRSRTKTPLDFLIDKAVGGEEDEQYMTEFVDWVTKNHWGEDCAPQLWKSRHIRSADNS